MVDSVRGIELVREFRAQFGKPEDKSTPRSTSHLQDEPEHKFILTAKRGTNNKVLVVRCKCMAEYRNVSDKYYNYDPLGEAHSIEEAVRLYEEHTED